MEEPHPMDKPNTLSFRERQQQELEVIKSIFNKDVDVLRPNCMPDVPAAQWKPTEVRISLTPLRDSKNDTQEIHVRAKLHITCPSKYPKVPPKIQLEDVQGLSDRHIKELLRRLLVESETLRGEVMIYELTQVVQSFLRRYNMPPKGSLYDQMVQENEKREKERQEMKQLKEQLERQTLMEEVERQKEMFKTAVKRREEPRRSMSETNYQDHSSESSENSSPYCRGHFYANKCVEHRNSERLYFHKVGRQVQRGSCLGHSQKGFIAYTGIDLDSGQLLYVTEWTIKYLQLDKKCGIGGHCYWVSTESRCNGNHRVDVVISSIEKQVASLAQLQHKNLVQYECVLCKKGKEGLIVYLVQDFVLGTSLSNITTTIGWCTEGVRMVARGVLAALVYLHNKGVSHSRLLSSTVFMDNTGALRCTDFSLVSNLLELVGGAEQSTTQGDLPDFGALVESLMPSQTYEMRDFIEKCNSERTLSASELLEHPFLHTSLPGQDDKNNQLAIALTHRGPRRKSSGTPDVAARLDTRTPDRDLEQQQRSLQLQRKQLHQLGASSAFTPIVPTGQSRLHTEFEILQYLGKGAFGDVLKVRNLLDNRSYALKRVRLSACNRTLYRKIRREVELLSRLNHENVVRYYNSWIETATDSDEEEMAKLMEDDEDSNTNEICYPSKSNKISLGAKENDEENSSSSMWSGYVPNDDSDSDGIEFVDSNGEVANYDDNEDETEKTEASKNVKRTNLPHVRQVLYIQMEFCEKCTLRTAIDSNLCDKPDDLWRYFREIAEGLSHIHQQGIIHRDLKPVNIFLDSRDQIKIGDFGLATTSFLALQSQQDQTAQHSTQVASIEDGTGTGKVGTTLYVAPELTGNASKSTYSIKVDMYTLGVILFEMAHQPFTTGMERVQTIMDLRTPAIVIPVYMLNNSKYDKTVQILRWLLNHDPAKRPTAEELLASDLVPPPPVEANILQEMIRTALKEPQSKAYKHLVARCLQQENNEVTEYTYNYGISTHTLDSTKSLKPIFEFVKAKIVSLFRKHGGIEVNTPLLSPLTKRSNPWNHPVRLMTRSGCVVLLPSDLRTEFARYIAMSGMHMMRRYCIDRVYREEKVFNCHPKQSYECAFDVITSGPDSPLIDAELLALASEISNEIPRLREKNMRIRMTHTYLLRAILTHCNVPTTSYKELFANVADFVEGRITKFQLHSSVTTIMEKSRSSASALIDLLQVNFLLSCTRSNVDESPLKTLLRGKGEAALLARNALKQLESVMELAQSLGLTCPIYIFTGLPISFERINNIGVVWQLIADIKPNRLARPSVLATGERYDTLLNDFQEQAQRLNKNVPVRGVRAAGLSIWLDKLVAAIDPNDIKECRAVDVGICVHGTHAPHKQIADIMRLLWSSNIRCCVAESAFDTGEEAQDLVKLGALHIILVAENGGMRILSWERDRFNERHVTRTELKEFVNKLRSELGGANVNEYANQLAIASPGGSSSGNSGGNSGRGDGGLCSSASSSSIKNGYSSRLPNVEVIFMLHEKLTHNMKRRYENQVSQQMSATLSQFTKKESVVVLVVDLPTTLVNAIVGAVYPRDIDKRESQIEFYQLGERYPKYKRYIFEIKNEIRDYIIGDKTIIVALFTISDSYYRVIL
uniref:non-specific serine/threonine protein kinase n=1 Tax=Ceratitis capitata TaxID=7213 RepID=W8B1Y4_CERCA